MQFGPGIKIGSGFRGAIGTTLLGAGVTLNFADGGSGVVRIEATSAQDYRCSVSADVEIIEQART